MAERWAHRWVEWALFAQRLAANDSLLDSATVLWAMWPDVHRLVIESYHERLVTERVRVDSALVDSAYAAGEQRAIDHILIRTSSVMSDSQEADARGRAEALRARLAVGGSWERANEANEDTAAAQRNGFAGVVERGQMVDQFERAAFALAPGELSAVTRTTYGYHIIRRPLLSEVRDRFWQGVEDVLARRMDSTFLAELPERWDVKVHSGAPALLRETAREPLAARGSTGVLGSSKGGKYTVQDLVRWLQALPPQTWYQIRAAGDEQLIEFARSLIRNEVLFQEARASGVELSDEDYAELKFRLKRDVDEVRVALRLDSILAPAATERERRRASAQASLELVRKAIVPKVGMMVRRSSEVHVPPFLADKLRSEMRWSVSPAGLDRVIQRANALRAEEESPATKTASDSGARPDPPRDSSKGAPATDRRP
jgi:hypothetical protein